MTVRSFDPDLVMNTTATSTFNAFAEAQRREQKKKEVAEHVGSGFSDDMDLAMFEAARRAAEDVEQDDEGMLWGDEMPTEFRGIGHEFACHFVFNGFFSYGVLLVILANVITVMLQTDRVLAITWTHFFQVCEYVFLTIYTVEAMLKIYCLPKLYWRSSSNLLDFSILVVSVIQQAASNVNLSFLRVLRGLRALRALRAIQFFHQLQIIVNALMKTLVSIVYLIALLGIFLYIFAIMGVYMFGHDDALHWSGIDSAILSLHVFITADGWTGLQGFLEATSGGKWTRWFSLVAIFFGNILFTNLFIGVILENLDQSKKELEAMDRLQRDKSVRRKRQAIADRQVRELQQILQVQGPDLVSLQRMMAVLAGKLRHDDVISMNDIVTNLQWMRTFMGVLGHQENSMYRVQQLQFEIALTLAEIMERRLAGAAMGPSRLDPGGDVVRPLANSLPPVACADQEAARVVGRDSETEARAAVTALRAFPSSANVQAIVALLSKGADAQPPERVATGGHGGSSVKVLPPPRPLTHDHGS